MLPHPCFAPSVGEESALHPAYRQAGPTAPFQEVLKRCRTPTATLPTGRQALWWENSTFWKNWIMCRYANVLMMGLLALGEARECANMQMC